MITLSAVTSVKTARERMVRGAVQLIRTQGVAGTGLREVVEVAEAPRGSLQHYFPDGKDQLVGEAIEWAADFAASRIPKFVAGMRSPSPSRLFAAMVDQWRTEFRRQGYAAGCPFVAAAADVAASNDALRIRLADALQHWLRPVADALRGMGVPSRRASSLATLMISALEGAIVLSRVQQSVAPLDTVVRELAPLLDAAVTAGGRAG
jgi:AcrR family transcriptional regulator